MNKNPTIAYFITPHGFGHAARASAVMLAMQQRIPNLHFEIYTLVPEWFFAESSISHYTIHPCRTDIGLAQSTPMEEDLPETIRQLDEYLPFRPQFVSSLAEQITLQDCQLVLCDISPLGIQVGHQAGLPSILMENFTWDWIYRGYAHLYPEILKHSRYLSDVFSSASFHIQTLPVCQVSSCDLTVPPVSRLPHLPSQTIRDSLSLPVDQPSVLVTMGGIDASFTQQQALLQIPKITFILPGSSKTLQRQDNLVLMPYHSTFYHPDLMQVCSTVVGKLGYSTLAEAYNAAIPYGYIPRATFPESPPLGAFVRNVMHGIEISPADYQSGAWLKKIPALLDSPRPSRNSPNGAGLIADFVLPLLQDQA